jgi:hypothetical protein
VTKLELSSLPAEVILSVLCSLSTFPDMLHLAAACQKHRQVFHETVITIYNHVSPRAIPCRRYARRLLVDQGRSLPNETPTVEDLFQMTRNSIVMEKVTTLMRRSLLGWPLRAACVCWLGLGICIYLTAKQTRPVIRNF